MACCRSEGEQTVKLLDPFDHSFNVMPWPLTNSHFCSSLAYSLTTVLDISRQCPGKNFSIYGKKQWLRDISGPGIKIVLTGTWAADNATGLYLFPGVSLTFFQFWTH